MSPANVEPITSIPNLATSRLNELANFVSPYRTITYSTPPIPPSGMGIPHGLIPNELLGAMKMSTHPSPPGTFTRPPIANIEECMARIKEDLNKQFCETLGVDLKGRDRIYQKLYPHTLIRSHIPLDGVFSTSSNLIGEDSKTTWEHVSQYVAQLRKVSFSEALKVRLFFLSLTGTAFSWFSSLSPRSIHVGVFRAQVL